MVCVDVFSVYDCRQRRATSGAAFLSPNISHHQGPTEDLSSIFGADCSVFGSMPIPWECLGLILRNFSKPGVGRVVQLDGGLSEKLVP